MMHLTKVSAALLAMITLAFIFYFVIATGKTIYSVPFDYKKTTPSSIHFSGKSSEEIDRFCETGEHASNSDMAACSQSEFEKAAEELNLTIESLESEYKKGDIDLKADNDPLASPYFKEAQNAWVTYRDNQCYAETYSLGEASMRYITFWDCMTRITKERLSDIKSVSVKN